MLVQGNAANASRQPASVIAEVVGGLSTRLNRTKARRGQAHHRDKASERCPYRLAGAQNSQIWIACVLIIIVPTSDHNGGSVCVIVLHLCHSA